MDRSSKLQAVSQCCLNACRDEVATLISICDGLSQSEHWANRLGQMWFACQDLLVMRLPHHGFRTLPAITEPTT
jgi:hypothetical protein